nr:hypothetical protein [Bacteroidetes bacterium endosymbiont of Geopemphigus sp.]
MTTWKNRSLESKYLIICFDGIKVHESSKVINKTIDPPHFTWPPAKSR